MNVFITGGAGFIGSNLTEFHLLKNDSVTVLDDLSSGTLANLAAFQKNPNFNFVKANLLDWNGLNAAIEWADRIYHLAAIVGVFKVLSDPIDVLKVNLVGCQRLLEVASEKNRSKRILIASTSEIYGSNQETILNEDAMSILNSSDTRACYPISKLATETMGLNYSRKKGLAINVVRLFNVIGPNQTGRYGMAVPRFIQQAVNNEPITVYGDGKQTRSFGDVRDIVKALDLIASTDKTVNEVMNVGDDQEITIENLAKKIKSLAGSNSEIIHLSFLEAYGEDTEDQIYHRKPDLSKLYKLTSFKPEWDLEMSLKDLIRRKKDALL